MVTTLHVSQMLWKAALLSISRGSSRNPKALERTLAAAMQMRFLVILISEVYHHG